MFRIYGIPAFTDNYIWCLINENNKAIIVDPGCAKSVETYLAENALSLEAILVTHHHFDHIGGVKQLKDKYKPKVYGFEDANFDFLDYKFREGQTFQLLSLDFKVLEVPGHTLDHISFFTNIPTADSEGNLHQQPSLFCGDTLFSGGCGRLFEGTAEQMLDSLNKIARLPENTLIYCAHEYTLSNLSFAQSVMPTNQNLKNYLIECKKRRNEGSPTIPSSLATELKINPFLRSDDPEIFSTLKAQGLVPEMDEQAVFRATRKAKDNF